MIGAASWDSAMQMFALDVDVEQLEPALLPLRGAARLPLLVELAWHLRQRDSARAATLAIEALALLECAKLAAPECQRIEARLRLIQAEIRWLCGELDAAATLAQEAFRLSCPLGDHTACADAHWLQAWIAVDHGDHTRCDAELALAADNARSANDDVRVSVAEAALARWAVRHDWHDATTRWGNHFDIQQMAPAAAAWVNDFLGLAASASSNFGAAAACFIHCYEAALETGQLRVAITAAINLGGDFTKLNDHHSALEWMQCALDLARPTGWPRSIGACLMHTADTMRRLGRLDAAEEMLQEALLIMAPLAGARSYAIALQFLGDLALDKGDYAAALDAFVHLIERASALNQADFHSTARRGQAHALSRLNRPAPALQAALEAVELAAQQGHAYNQIAALRVLANIHACHSLPPPEPMASTSATLHYLEQALALAATIADFPLPGDLLDDLAHEHARQGNYAQAYEVALAASAARSQSHSQDATNRAIALQVHHQTEHARAEGSHHRELAASEARRAEVLQRTSATLERLSAIGPDITTHLDASAVFQALDRHVHALLSASTFAIYLTDSAGRTLERAYGDMRELSGSMLNRVHGNDDRQRQAAIPLSRLHADPVRCLLERREVYVEHGADHAHEHEHDCEHEHGSRPKREAEKKQGLEDADATGRTPNLSALYVPLVVGERTLGVMTVQARHAQAYGEHERLIFRTLCAYGAIALDNACAYRQLQDAQAQLVSHEKLAALGALMAGIAHELNTPIGNSLLIAGAMQQKTEELEAKLNGPGLRRTDLTAFIADGRTASELVMRGLTSAADLVNSFKQVALDRTTEQRRVFDLQQVAHEIIATMMNRVHASSHKLETTIAAGIIMDSYPGPFGQVITNFINNALLHAFEGRADGKMWLSATRTQDARVHIEFGDNGSGIERDHIKRIFDPFFTTKMGQGGSGLGLSISYNIITALLGGQISVVSSAEGTSFRLDLPLSAPQHDPARPANIY
ncbi:MAG: signal transduction histidine kinase/tetratricopeptide (TPR) repeat protein [Janthinobacterium sp.]|jgi:signal transduction histidine kinase/tetratricopeptide (TPR) repeat protein